MVSSKENETQQRSMLRVNVCSYEVYNIKKCRNSMSYGNLMRREGDSNPRNALGVYTLSRRASSTTRAPFLVLKRCKATIFIWKSGTFHQKSAIKMSDFLANLFFAEQGFEPDDFVTILCGLQEIEFLGSLLH